ncbi:MAG TPA: glycosyltransferase family 39 protein [Methylomirabilota bacterium]|nr:glycosyltransferase family 39 protein [Methylomirabilota bacterium]
MAGLAGDVLLLAFVAARSTTPGLTRTFDTAQNAFSPNDLHLWLGHALLLFPATCLLGYSLAPRLGPWFVARWAALRTLRAPGRMLGLALLFILFVVGARAGHRAVLEDLPLTDDEYAVEFGGRILATGHVTAPLPLPEAAIPLLGLYVDAGRIVRADWPGGQAVAAVAEMTDLGAWAWAVLAAVPVVALGALLARRLGTPWGLVAGLTFAGSPMALMLSFTSHAHLASRAMLALTIAAYWLSTQRGSLAAWALTGLAFGAGFLCRPFEIVFFSLPLLAWAVAQGLRRQPGYARAIPGLVLGALLPIALMLAHAYAVTGHPLMPPRMTATHDVAAVTLWTRFGSNLAYNVLMLAVWFLGPLGLILVTAGVMTDTFTRLLGLGVVTALLLALFHTNVGIHTVGPIHYSECAVPLTVIAVHGLANLLRGARAHGLDARPLACAFGLALVVGLGIFNVAHAFTLRDQARVQRDIYGWIERGVRESGAGRAVVLAPQFAEIWFRVPWMREVGTWVFEWRRPRLDLTEGLLIVHDGPGVEEWFRERMPDRRIYRIRLLWVMPYAVLSAVPGGAPIPLCLPGPTRGCTRP